MTATTAPVRDPIDERVEHQRAVVDAGLTRPARWAGRLRRTHGHPSDAPRRYASAFDAVVAETPATLDSQWLLQVHDTLHADRGYRSSRVRVNGRNTPAARDVADLVDAALARAAASRDPAPVTATRLHLDIARIHPFRDGNGRSARIAAAALLVRAGFRSTLFTAVEQHRIWAHRTYNDDFRQLEDSVIDGDEWCRRALHAMAACSDMAAWFRQRSTRMRGQLDAAGVPDDEMEQALIDYDFGLTRRQPGIDEEPWHLLRDRMSAPRLARLRSQLERLRAEETAEGTTGYTPGR